MRSGLRAGSRTMMALGFAAFAGCMGPAPTAAEGALGEGCEGTSEGQACLVMRFALDDELRADAGERARGPLHWALFRGGDVGLFGPGDAEAVREGVTEAPVDLATPGAAWTLSLPGLAPGEYQVLAFLDHDGDGDDSDGDPVTFPSDAFAVRPDRRTALDVRLDYVR